jgi:hypothetical protein
MKRGLGFGVWGLGLFPSVTKLYFNGKLIALIKEQMKRKNNCYVNFEEKLKLLKDMSGNDFCIFYTESKVVYPCELKSLRERSRERSQMRTANFIF